VPHPSYCTPPNGAVECATAPLPPTHSLLSRRFCAQSVNRAGMSIDWQQPSSENGSTYDEGYINVFGWFTHEGADVTPPTAKEVFRTAAMDGITAWRHVFSPDRIA